MKKKIHPEYKKTVVTCGCGNTFETRSTRERIGIEICSACHPFYTGKERFVDTAGRVERFQRKWTSGEAQKKAQEHAERRARREMAVERARKKAEAVTKGEARLEDLGKMDLPKRAAPAATSSAPAAGPKPGTK